MWGFRLALWVLGGLMFNSGRLGAADRDWPVYHGDAEGTHYSTLRQIDRRNVHRLQPAWVYRCGEARANGGSTIECNPLILDGRMYLTTPGLRVVAVDAATGAELWAFDPWNGRGGGGVNRGLATWAGETNSNPGIETKNQVGQAGRDRSPSSSAQDFGGTGRGGRWGNAALDGAIDLPTKGGEARRDGEGRRLFFAAGWKLYALSAATGRPIPEFGTGGFIDLREGLDQDAFYLSVNAPTPGVVYRDLLIMGSSIPDALPPTAPGHIRAYDVRTGQRRWIFHTLPHPGEPGYETWGPDNWQHNGGANAWGGVTLDARAGVVYCGTGSANYDHFGGDRPGANLYANCILALDAATGALRWHFQTVHHDVWDYDLPCAPVLVDLRGGWRRVPALVQSTKMGHLFVLDRRTGTPLFPVEERPVPPSDVPGEQVWPTQPFPVKPPPFVRQGLCQEDLTNLSEDARKGVEARFKTMRSEGLFTPPSRTPTVVMPQFNGGGEWGGPAVDPKRGWVYVNGSSEPEWIQMLPARLPDGVTAHELGGHLFRATCSQCHGAGRPDLPRTPALQSLKDVAQRLSRESVLTLLETGRGQMPSFAAMSLVERRAVVAFLFGDRGGEPVKAADLDQGWARRIPWVADGHPEFRDAEGFPASAPPWGTLTAIDLRRGDIAWQIPLGTYPELEKRGLPPTGTFNIGGPLVTAGGLVFIGAAMDERFRAVDARTGRLLWEHTLDAGGYATPATFEVKGRQYVVIAAGGGGKPGTRSGDGWWCFALPDRR